MPLLMMWREERNAEPSPIAAPLGWSGVEEFEFPERPEAGSSIYNQVSESVVLLHCRRPDGMARGSGFVLSPGDRLITNEHVVRDAHFVVVETYWGQRITINKILAIDERRDLAVLPLPKEYKGRGLEFSKRTHEIGERIYTIGSPKGTFFSITEGVISQFQISRQVHEVVADIGAAPGASGSPVCDVDGNLLGVIARGREDTHVAVAIHYKELVALLAESEDQPMQTMKPSSWADLN